MKVTYILKNLTDEFYNSTGGFIGLADMGERQRFDYLNKQANGGDLRHCIAQKIATGQFRDKVELNALLRGPVSIAYKLENRKGYKLATFEIEALITLQKIRA